MKETWKTFYIEELGSILVICGVRDITHNSYIKKVKVLSTCYPLHVSFGGPDDNHLSPYLKPISRNRKPTKLHQGSEIPAMLEKAGELLAI